MALQSEYPPISKCYDPLSTFTLLEFRPNVETIAEDNSVKVRSYNKSIFGNKKVYEIIIEKIDNPDDFTKTYHGSSNGKVFGMIIYEKGKETNRSMYDCGMMRSVVEGMIDLYTEEAKDDISSKGRLSYLQKISPLANILYIQKMIEKLFD
jgi:hypothetical protein